MTNADTKIINLRPHHCGIFVPEIGSSIGWYTEMLGFTVCHRSSMKRGDKEIKVAFMKHGNFYIELFVQDEPY